MKNILNGTGLPYSYKKIGMAMILIGLFTPFVLSKTLTHEIISNVKMTLLLLGALMLVLSKGKKEDEMTEKIRLLALSYGFVFMFIMVIVSMWFFEEILISSLVLMSIIPCYLMLLVLESRNSANEKKGNYKLVIGVIVIIITLGSLFFFLR